VAAKAEARFLRDAFRIRVHGGEKLLDLFRSLLIAAHKLLTRLDVMSHLRLHSCAPRMDEINPEAREKFLFGGKAKLPRKG
jgi:hypothetical protein